MWGKQVEFQAQSCFVLFLPIQDMALLEGGEGGRSTTKQDVVYDVEVIIK